MFPRSETTPGAGLPPPASPSTARAALTVQVSGPTPLIRAGLERVAAAAGLSVVRRGEVADVQLRSTPGLGSPLEVIAEVGLITVRISQIPDALAWECVRDLVERLLSAPSR